MTALFEALQHFGELVASQPSFGKLLKGWEPYIQVETIDTGLCYTLIIRSSRLAEIVPGLQGHPHLISLKGVEAAFLSVFSGALTAAEAVIDGQIEVYGSEKDLVRLDALTLVLLA